MRSQGRKTVREPQRRTPPTQRGAHRPASFSASRVGLPIVVIQTGLGQADEDKSDEFVDGFWEAALSLAQAGAIVLLWTEDWRTANITNLLKQPVAQNGLIVGSVVTAGSRIMRFLEEHRKIIVVCDDVAREYLEERADRHKMLHFASGDDVFSMLANAGEKI